jgi:hypothetical protein
MMHSPAMHKGTPGRSKPPYRALDGTPKGMGGGTGIKSVELGIKPQAGVQDSYPQAGYGSFGKKNNGGGGGGFNNA